MNLYFRLLLLVNCCFIYASGQEFSNKGREFWLVFPPHQPSGNSLANLSIYLTSDKNSSGKIEYNGITQNFVVTANQTAEVILTRSASYITGTESANYNSGTDQTRIVANRGIKITVDPGQPAVVAYAHMFAGARSAASLILPTAVLGKTYYAMSWAQTTTASQGNELARSQFSVIATEDNTSLRITVKRDGVILPTPILVDLPRAGDVYQFQDAGDITGTYVESVVSGSNSCKKIAVFSGSSSLGISTNLNGAGCTGANGQFQSSIDPLYQQCYPINSWGKTYGITPFRGKNRLNYRIIASEDNTTITFNGGNPIVLSKGSTHTGFSDASLTVGLKAPMLIQADKPIAVAQFSLTQACDIGVGDPDMIILNPIEQSISDITVFLSAKQLIVDQNINVFIKNAGTAISSFKVNGVAPTGSFIAIGNSGYSYLQQQFTVISGGSSSIRLTSDSGFNAICYGFGSAESYGYSAGTNIIDLNPPITIQNQFAAGNIAFSATCSNTPFKINLALTYQPTQIVVDFGGASGLTGTSPFTYVPTGTTPYDSTYQSNGKTYFLYRIPQTYSIGTAGTYPVKLTTTSNTIQSDGCSNTNTQEFTDNIVVNAAPIGRIAINTNNCVGFGAVALADASNGLGRPFVRWLWDFGGGITRTDQNPTQDLFTPGNYTLKLTAITDFGCVATDQVNFSLSNKPVAAFTVPAIRCENSLINFTDASTIVPGSTNNTITRWNWNLDNGAGFFDVNSNAPQSATYTAWGNKDVRLTVASNTGCVSDTFRLSPAFKINPTPQVGFTLPEVCLSDANAPFTDISSIADGTQAGFTYLWNFNAGSPAITPGPTFAAGVTAQKNPAPKYNKADNYTVSLSVTSNNGCVASLSKAFTVNGSTPIPNFVIQSNPICSNDSIRITNTSSVDFGSLTRLDIYWDTLNAPAVRARDEDPFPNKGYSNKYAAFASAAAPANRSITISLVAASGQSAACSRSIKKVISLNNSPAVTFVKPRDICNEAVPRQITQGSFISAVTSNTAVYSGTGVSSNGLYTPQSIAAGTYPLKYLVTNAAGCKDSASQPITVWPTPIAKWGVQAITCEKNTIAFTDSSVANFSNIVQRKWNFGNGVIDTKTTVTNFNVVYQTAQNYTVSLQVVTDSGCTSTLNTQPIKINPLPQLAFTLPTVVCLPDGRATFTNQSSIADASESLFSYFWTFGDPNNATPSLLKEPTHKYSAVGPVNVTLKVTSKDGCVDSLTKSFNTIYPWPKANIGMAFNTACVGDTVQFFDNGNGISSIATAWNWNLDQGFTSSLRNPARRFADSGTYTIRYFFTNVQGCVSDTVSKELIVYPYPKLSLPNRINVLEGGNKAIVPTYTYGTNLNYLWTPPTYLNNPTDSMPVTTPLGDITYRLFLSGIGGCTVSDTVLVKLLLKPIVPNAFSPNGDGINDRWRIQYLESYPGATVDVFNRYGQTVLSVVGYSVDWDGSFKGSPLPVGTYYYVINPKNGRSIISGSVTIIR